MLITAIFILACTSQNILAYLMLLRPFQAISALFSDFPASFYGNHPPIKNYCVSMKPCKKAAEPYPHNHKNMIQQGFGFALQIRKMKKFRPVPETE